MFQVILRGAERLMLMLPVTKSCLSSSLPSHWLCYIDIPCFGRFACLLHRSPQRSGTLQRESRQTDWIRALQRCRDVLTDRLQATEGCSKQQRSDGLRSEQQRCSACTFHLHVSPDRFALFGTRQFLLTFSDAAGLAVVGSVHQLGDDEKTSSRGSF